MQVVLRRAVVLSVLPLTAGAWVTPVAAQGGPSLGASIRVIASPAGEMGGSCLRNLPDSVGLRATAYLGLLAADSLAPPLREQVENFTATLDDAIRHALGASGDELPQVRVTSGGFGPSTVSLIVRHDGSFTWTATDSAPTSAITRLLLVNALDATRKSGETILWPDGVPGDSARVRLHMGMWGINKGQLVGDEPLPRALPVFATRILSEKPAAPKHSVTPTFPDTNRRAGWMGIIRMQFVVDTTGHAVDSTVKAIWPGHGPDLTGSERDAYDAFVRAVERAIRLSTYYPAEVAGCKVNQIVQREFDFNFFGPQQP